MKSGDLTSEQAEIIRSTLARQLRYLERLTERMNRVGFPADDPVRIAAVRTAREMCGLMMAVHYAACSGGVGQPARG